MYIGYHSLVNVTLQQFSYYNNLANVKFGFWNANVERPNHVFPY
jgi:hypothetical protein